MIEYKIIHNKNVDVVDEICVVDETFKYMDWDDPPSWLLNDPRFNAVWECIKRWDINVPDAYHGYCGATGNHVYAILKALYWDVDASKSSLPPSKIVSLNDLKPF